MRRSSFNLASETAKRRKLRAEMPRGAVDVAPAAERGVRGEIQTSVFGGSYVLDFYCPQLHLAIEIDGVSHEDDAAIAYDAERQRRLEGLGVRFLRVTNDQVFHHMADVMETLQGRIAELQAENC